MAVPQPRDHHETFPCNHPVGRVHLDLPGGAHGGDHSTMYHQSGVGKGRSIRRLIDLGSDDHRVFRSC